MINKLKYAIIANIANFNPLYYDHKAVDGVGNETVYAYEM